MPCNLKSVPTEIAITLSYPYLKEDEYPVHYFPRLTWEQGRELRELLFGKNDDEKAGSWEEAVFGWWSKTVKGKTRESYEGLGEDWQSELWNNPEGRWHILHATQGFFTAITPQRFLAV